MSGGRRPLGFRPFITPGVVDSNQQPGTDWEGEAYFYLHVFSYFLAILGFFFLVNPSAARLPNLEIRSCTKINQGSSIITFTSADEAGRRCRNLSVD